jgi:hypothetical protein
VLVLSLRLQLQGPQNSLKAVVAATLNADNAHNAYRCVAVAWVPRSNGSQFLAAHADGMILVYKKASSSQQQQPCTRPGAQQAVVLEAQAAVHTPLHPANPVPAAAAAV